MHSLAGALIVFLIAAAAVWYAGVRLSISSDALTDRLRWGEALGGLILLGIVTNLPELAIVVTGALRRDLRVAVGDILGDISNQVLVLVIGLEQRQRILGFLLLDGLEHLVGDLGAEIVLGRHIGIPP